MLGAEPGTGRCARGPWEPGSQPPPRPPAPPPGTPAPRLLADPLHQPPAVQSLPWPRPVPWPETQSYRCFSPGALLQSKGQLEQFCQPCLTSQGTILNARRRSCLSGSREPHAAAQPPPQRGRDAQGGSALHWAFPRHRPRGQGAQERVSVWLGRGGRSRHRRGPSRGAAASCLRESWQTAGT